MNKEIVFELEQRYVTKNLVCRFCGNLFNRPCGLKIHEDSCKENPNRIHRKTVCNLPKESPLKSKEGGWDCIYCSENFRTRRELEKHRHDCHPETLRHSVWNKGKTIETDERIKRFSEIQKKKYKNGVLVAPQTGKPRTEEEKRKISEGLRKAQKLGKMIGGYKPHRRGHGKKCRLDGEFLTLHGKSRIGFIVKNMVCTWRGTRKSFYMNTTERSIDICQTFLTAPHT